MTLQPVDLLLAATVLILAADVNVRESIAVRLVQAWDSIHQFLRERPLLPTAPVIEGFLLALGSVAFVMVRARSIREMGVTHKKNRIFIATLALGLLLASFSPEG